jgi:hypothetical protein
MMDINESGDVNTSANELAASFRRVSEASTRDIELVTQLQRLRTQLENAGNRIERDIAQYTELSQQTVQLAAIISDSVKNYLMVPNYRDTTRSIWWRQFVRASRSSLKVNGAAANSAERHVAIRLSNQQLRQLRDISRDPPRLSFVSSLAAERRPRSSLTSFRADLCIFRGFSLGKFSPYLFDFRKGCGQFESDVTQRGK